MGQISCEHTLRQASQGHCPEITAKWETVACNTLLQYWGQRRQAGEHGGGGHTALEEEAESSQVPSAARRPSLGQGEPAQVPVAPLAPWWLCWAQRLPCPPAVVKGRAEPEAEGLRPALVSPESAGRAGLPINPSLSLAGWASRAGLSPASSFPPWLQAEPNRNSLSLGKSLLAL